MADRHYCCFCKHHGVEENSEKDAKKRISNLLKPYSVVCKCNLERKEHNYFPTWGNDCCITSPVECECFEAK